MQHIQKAQHFAKAFMIPLLVILGAALYGIFYYLHLPLIAVLVILISIFIGTYQMLYETAISLTKKQFALDYIAIMAIFIAVITHEYIVGAILALMVATGSSLENYGVSQAKKSLTQLVDRIPTDIFTWSKDHPDKKVKLSQIKVHDEIFIRKGEVIALDGVLVSEAAETDESSLTGEPYFITKLKGDQVRSRTVNIGNPIVVTVTKAEKDSTYKKIITMVQQAEEEKSPFIRLADKYSTFFTIITFVLALFAFVVSHFSLDRVLAVLAVATPCPLIIATPIALLGGMNASAKRKIIIKKLAALEILSRVQTIAFDKTGTITLGKPRITNIQITNKSYSKEKVLSVAQAIERNSLHPLAKAVVAKATEEKVQSLHAINVQEKIGEGIHADVEGKEYFLKKLSENMGGMAIGLFEKGKQIAVFFFEDEIKKESRDIVERLQKKGLTMQIFTGDKKEVADKIASEIGGNIAVFAECSPEDKKERIRKLKEKGIVTAMVGDGINDAPALALADVGMAFSSEEQTAATDAADIVFLGGDFTMVLISWDIARKTISIAKQSIVYGIGLSIGAMIFASIGFIPPILGAGLQEAIDVAVIFNALRAALP